MSLREALTNREMPTITVGLRRVFTEEADTAEDALANARWAFQMAAESGGEVAEAREKLRHARAAAAPYQVRLVMRAVGKPRWVELLEDHPTPDDAATTPDAPSYNEATFFPALLAETVVDGDLSAEDWAVLIGKGGGTLTNGEVTALVDAAWSVNNRAPDVHVGKD